MRWLLLMTVAAGCAGCGYVYAGSMARRVALLQDLKGGWRSLRSRIQYFSDPLQQAFLQTAPLQPAHVSALFGHAGREIAATHDLSQAMANALRGAQAQAPIFGCLQSADREALISFAAKLGRDSNTQQAAFVWMDEYLEDEIARGRQRHQTQGRLYRVSGVLFGLLLVVLFW
jgi:stage III sporulation protein AB